MNTRNIGDKITVGGQSFEAVLHEGSGCGDCPFLYETHCPSLCWTEDGVELKFRALSTSEKTMERQP